MDIRQLLNEGTLKEKRSLFAFTIQDTDEVIAFKYNLWCRHFFPKYFTSKDAPFHKEADINRVKAYKGDISQYVDIAFRGASKTSRTKLFLAFCILNDLDHHRRYLRVLSADIDNAKQSITDIYNMLVVERVAMMYPETFAKTIAKREETMGSFTTATGIKAISTQIGVDQRGNIMEDAKADFDWYDDIETKKTIRSAKLTKNIGENMEEARTGLALGGSSIYTCNYFSELGNVHTLVTKPSNTKIVQIVPILNELGESNWADRYTKEDIAQMKIDDEDFEGERMCRPSASRDILFDRETLESMLILLPEREIAGFKMFKEFKASHRYASGHDVAGGVGLDSSTSVFIDFETIPAQVVATFANNMIKPDDFGHEIVRQADHYGSCLVGPEKNNHGHATIAILKQLGANIFRTQGKDSKIQNQVTTEYGWLTTGITKPKMLFALAKAVEDGQIQLNDKDLINECKSYSRNDLLDTENDPRLITRHFDLLVACFVEGTMVLTKHGQKPIQTLVVGDLVLTREGYKPIIATMCSLKPVTENIGLTGTFDHPVFCNDNDIKDLSCVDNDDRLYIWDSKAQRIGRQSFTMACRTTGILTRNKRNIGHIIWEVLSGRSLANTYIDRYGKTILERFQKVSLYITKTITKTTTTLITSSRYLQTNICLSTGQMRNEKKLSGNGSRQVEAKSTIASRHIGKTNRGETQPVYIAGPSMVRSPIIQSTVPHFVHKEQGAKKERSQRLKTSVLSVIRSLVREYPTGNGVRNCVAKSEGENNIQKVYNIQVADCPEYFANDILVHNCAIAWQMKDFAEYPAINNFGEDDFVPEEPLYAHIGI